MNSSLMNSDDGMSVTHSDMEVTLLRKVLKQMRHIEKLRGINTGLCNKLAYRREQVRDYYNEHLELCSLRRAIDLDNGVTISPLDGNQVPCNVADVVYTSEGDAYVVIGVNRWSVFVPESDGSIRAMRGASLTHVAKGEDSMAMIRDDTFLKPNDYFANRKIHGTVFLLDGQFGSVDPELIQRMDLCNRTKNVTLNNNTTTEGRM